MLLPLGRCGLAGQGGCSLRGANHPGWVETVCWPPACLSLLPAGAALAGWSPMHRTQPGFKSCFGVPQHHHLAPGVPGSRSGVPRAAGRAGGGRVCQERRSLCGRRPVRRLPQVRIRRPSQMSAAAAAADYALPPQLPARLRAERLSAGAALLLPLCLPACATASSRPRARPLLCAAAARRR